MARLRGFLWLFAGLVVAGIAGVIAFQTLARVAEAPATGSGGAAPQVDIVVARRTIAVRSLLTDEDVEVRQVPVDATSEGAVRSVQDAIGKLTTVDLVPGEAILTHRLVDPTVVARSGRVALVMVEDEVLMAVPAQDLMSRIGVLKPGDRVDVLYSLEFPTDRTPGSTGDADDEQATFHLLQNVAVAALVGGDQSAAGAAASVSGQEAGQEIIRPEAILFTLNPQDALVLKYVMDAGGTIDLVLRAPGVERPFDTNPVDTDYLIDRYDIPFQVGR